MCLTISEFKSVKKTQLEKNGFIWGYKCIVTYIWFGKKVVRSWLYQHLWKNGWNQSCRKNTEISPIENYRGKISTGFHVFLNREDARNYKKTYANISSRIKIIKVKCFRKHLVSFGMSPLLETPTKTYSPTSVVFTRVFLPKGQI